MPTTFRTRALVAALAAFGIAFLLWNTPALDFILYPLRLFVTFVHETGHGLAALITGGQIDRLRVFTNGSGVAGTYGGARWLILPAGYLGAALFGAGLFVAANRVRHTRVIMAALGLFVGVVALVYTDLFSTGFLVGLAFAAVLMLLSRRGSDNVNLVLLNLLAVICALNAVLDLVSLVRFSDQSIGTVRNDAAAFAREITPLIPGAVWALLWAGIAIALMLGAIYVGLIQPHRRRSSEGSTDF